MIKFIIASSQLLEEQEPYALEPLQEKGKKIGYMHLIFMSMILLILLILFVLNIYLYTSTKDIQTIDTDKIFNNIIRPYQEKGEQDIIKSYINTIDAIKDIILEIYKKDIGNIETNEALMTTLKTLQKDDKIGIINNIIKLLETNRSPLKISDEQLKQILNINPTEHYGSIKILSILIFIISTILFILFNVYISKKTF